MINITRNLYDQLVFANVYPINENLAINNTCGIASLQLEVSVKDNMVPISLCSIFIHDSVNHLAILWVIPLYQDAVNLIVFGVCDVER
jgi:hypothetical protein